MVNDIAIQFKSGKPIENSFFDALASASPGDRLIYYTGPSGMCDDKTLSIAWGAYTRGLCLLAQRLTGRSANGHRIWEMMAIKTSGVKK